MTCYQMKGSGYCYEMEAHPRANWRSCHEDYWQLETYGGDEKCQHVGFRYIDGHEHAVFACPDGIYRARLATYCRVTEPARS